jgi:spore maturation protein CgeB
MKLRLMYHGPLWHGSTSMQRALAFSQIPGVELVQSDSGERISDKWNLIQRVRWKLSWPSDSAHENAKMLARAREFDANIIFVDNSKVISRSTLARLRRMSGAKLVYYTPDNVLARHAISYQIRTSFKEWDVFFTTKSFNVAPLAELGVKRPLLVGKAFDPSLHFPLERQDVGPDFESFDVVFIGSYEFERCRSINALAAAGMSVVVYSGQHKRWRRALLHPNVVLRQDIYAEAYTRAWHHGKLALGFLRKITSDRITQRSIEVAAIGRPMLAQRTDEHDAHFSHEHEYIGFESDDDLVEKARSWLARDSDRVALGEAARHRCVTSGYSTLDRAKWMIEQISGTNFN